VDARNELLDINELFFVPIFKQMGKLPSNNRKLERHLLFTVHKEMCGTWTTQVQGNGEIEHV